MTFARWSAPQPLRTAEKNIFRTVCFVALSVMSASGADYYVSPNGSSAGNGSIQKPWDIATAFRHPAAVKPGDTINLRGGTYQAPQRLLWHVKLNGAANNWITIRPNPGEEARIDGGLQVLGSYVIIRDLEVMNSNPVRYTAQVGSFPSDITQPAGIEVFGKGVRVINCIVHDTRNGITSWQDASDNEFYGNIIYYSGWKAPDRGHGHGLYMQNRTGTKVIADNMSFHQFAQGMQVYGSSAVNLNNFHVEGNIVFSNGTLAKSLTRNVFIGGTAMVKDAVIRENYSYYPTVRNHGGENNIGYYSSGVGCSNTIFEHNYFVSGGIGLSYWKCAGKVQNNTIIGETRGFSTSSYPGNTFVPVSSRPSAQKIVVRPNKYERGRAHIAVFNWPRLSTAGVDLSNIGLSLGDMYEVFDAQNVLGPAVVKGSYTGAPVQLPMNLTAMAVPSGAVPPPHTDSEFNAFLVRRVSGGPDTGVQPLTMTTPQVGQITASSAVIAWTTNRTANSQVEYGTTTALGSVTATGANLTNHSASLSGLPAGSTIYYRVRSVAADGEVAQSGTLSFQTAAAPAPAPTPTPAPAPTPTPTPTPSPTPTTPTPSPAPSVMTYFEAENAARHNPNGYVEVQDRFAIINTGGIKYVSAPVAEKSYLVFTMYAPAAGQYNMWFRVLATSAAASEMYVSVDGGPEQLFKTAYGTWSNQWQWSKLNSAGATGTPVARTLTLSRGVHTFVVRSKHAKVGIDKFLLTDGLSFVPSN